MKKKAFTKDGFIEVESKESQKINKTDSKLPKLTGNFIPYMQDTPIKKSKSCGLRKDSEGVTNKEGKVSMDCNSSGFAQPSDKIRWAGKEIKEYWKKIPMTTPHKFIRAERQILDDKVFLDADFAITIEELKEFNGLIKSKEDVFDFMNRLLKCSKCKNDFYDKFCPECVITKEEVIDIIETTSLFEEELSDYFAMTDKNLMIANKSIDEFRRKLFKQIKEVKE